MSGNRVAATPASLEDEVEDVPRNECSRAHLEQQQNFFVSGGACSHHPSRMILNTVLASLRSGDDDEEDPFTEEEVAQMHEEIRELAQQMYTNEEEYNNFLSELDAELEENNDLQERGHILLDVLEYLQNPEEGEEGDYGVGDDTEGAPARPATAGGDGDEVEEMEPYPGEEGLQELWKELQEVCSEDDIKRLEDELASQRRQDAPPPPSTPVPSCPSPLPCPSPQAWAGAAAQDVGVSPDVAPRHACAVWRRSRTASGRRSNGRS